MKEKKTCNTNITIHLYFNTNYVTRKYIRNILKWKKDKKLKKKMSPIHSTINLENFLKLME